MNWSESTVTKLLIENVKALDPVTVYIENFELGRGKLTIEVFGKSWSACWGAMGKQRLEQFILNADNHYLSKNLASLGDLSENDYDAFIAYARQLILEQRKEGYITKAEARKRWELSHDVSPEKGYFDESFNHDTLHELVSEWYEAIPRKDSDLYRYLCRILDAVKECLGQREELKV